MYICTSRTRVPYLVVTMVGGQLDGGTVVGGHPVDVGSVLQKVANNATATL